MISKNAITLLSSIGASSVPVVSVIALYKIKSFSRGNDLASVSSNATEESVISDITPPEPQPEEKNDKIPEPVVPKVETTNVEPTPPSDTSPPPATEAPKKESETSAPTSTDTNDDEKEEETAKKVIERLEKIVNELAESLKNKDKPKTNEDITKNIDVFVELLTEKQKTITDKDEQESAKQVIDSLKTLKGKITT